MPAHRQFLRTIDFLLPPDNVTKVAVRKGRLTLTQQFEEKTVRARTLVEICSLFAHGL